MIQVLGLHNDSLKMKKRFTADENQFEYIAVWEKG